MNKQAIIGLLVFLGYPFFLKLLHLDIMLMEVAMWLLLLLIVFWIYFVEKRTIASIGWKKLTVKTIFRALGLGLVLFVLFGILTTAIQAIGLELNKEMAQLFASQPIPVLILIALRAGVVEEVLYRGYAFERIYELTKSKLVAGIAPMILFTLVHLAWGVGHLVFVFFAAGLITIVYAAKRDLALIIIAHFIVDVIALTVLPVLLDS
jgi:membrane protease YdiL (CAAX protease family)